LEARLAEERLRRHAAEDDLARHLAERPAKPLHEPEVAPDTDPDTAPDASPDVVEDDPDAPRIDPTDAYPTTGDDALDALIAGLRAQVASAREQLDTW